PPCASTIVRATQSPRPMPSFLVVKNESNSLGRSSNGVSTGGFALAICRFHYDSPVRSVLRTVSGNSCVKNSVRMKMATNRGRRLPAEPIPGYPVRYEAIELCHEAFMRKLVTALLIGLAMTSARAQVNVGEQKADTDLPFTMTTTSTFALPWRIAF